MNSDPKNVEDLSAEQHVLWCAWCKQMLEQIEKELLESTGDKWLKANMLGFFERLPCVERWRQMMETPYEELPERETKGVVVMPAGNPPLPRNVPDYGDQGFYREGKSMEISTDDE